MKNIILAALAALACAACFDPSLEGATCGPAGECPSGLTCDPGTNTCTSGGGPGIDAPGGNPDANTTPDAMVDPCDTVQCLDNATCVAGVCECPPGYREDGANGCDDLDECLEGTAGCDVNATCTNDVGSFTCTCNAGFQGDGFICTDNDECAKMTALCDVNAFCVNDKGTYGCVCNPGYVGDGFTCVDQDECADGTAGCDVNATCTNLDGSFVCGCNPGYTGSGAAGDCFDIDECLAPGTCDVNASCANFPGGFDCSCFPGYAGDGAPGTCADVNECVLGTDACAAVATCTNTTGSYTCACPPGYTGDGFTCTPVGTSVGQGQVILMGHDFFERNPNIDQLMGNAVLMANTTGPINVLGWSQYADNSAGGEVANVNAAINAEMVAAGRTAVITQLTDYNLLATQLVGKHVLVVYEAETGGAAPWTTIANVWRAPLWKFLDRGGVVIVTNFVSPEWQILSLTGVMTVTGPGASASFSNVNVVAPADPLAVGVASPYIGANGSNAMNGINPAEGTIVVAELPTGADVVMRRPWPCIPVGTDASGAVMCRQTMAIASLPCDDIGTTGTAVCTGSLDCEAPPIALPFSFTFYGLVTSTVYLETHGKLQFNAGTGIIYNNSCTIENNTIAALWDDINHGSMATLAVRHQVLGTAPNRRFIAKWNAPLSSGSPENIDVRARLDEGTNQITICYANIDFDAAGVSGDRGSTATTGVMGDAPGEGIQNSCNTGTLDDGMILRITP